MGSKVAAAQVWEADPERPRVRPAGTVTAAHRRSMSRRAISSRLIWRAAYNVTRRAAVIGGLTMGRSSATGVPLRVTHSYRSTAAQNEALVTLSQAVQRLRRKVPRRHRVTKPAGKAARS